MSRSNEKASKKIRASSSNTNTNQATHNKALKRPKLIVFDLDYTLWPFWVDTHVDPPFHVNGSKVYDRSRRHVKYYPEVPQVLQQLKGEGYTLGVASRTGAVDDAEQLLDLFDWNKYFTHKEIYPGSKTTHFQRLKRTTNFEYEEMIFLDDEHRNIRDVSALGVHAILVENGVNLKVMEETFASYSTKSN